MFKLKQMYDSIVRVYIRYTFFLFTIYKYENTNTSNLQ